MDQYCICYSMYFCYCTHGCVCQLVNKENADDDDDDDDLAKTRWMVLVYRATVW